MTYRLSALICALCLIFTLASCSWNDEPEAISGVAPPTANVDPIPITSADGFLYDSKLSLADSFKQMNSLRLSVCGAMYSAVAHLTDDSAWVLEAVDKYILGSDEFLAVSYVMETEPGPTAEKLMLEDGFTDIEISTLDIQNTWKITANKDENGAVNAYEYTVMYGAQSDSYRFTLSINDQPRMLLASCRTVGGYAVQAWTPEGSYHIFVDDVLEGRFGYIPPEEGEENTFPESDIYFDESLITSSFTTTNADYTFLLANDLLYITNDGSNYAIPLP